MLVLPLSLSPSVYILSSPWTLSLVSKVFGFNQIDLWRLNKDDGWAHAAKFDHFARSSYSSIRYLCSSFESHDVRIGRSESKLIFNIETHFFFSRSFIPSLKPIKMIQLSNLIWWVFMEFSQNGCVAGVNFTIPFKNAPFLFRVWFLCCFGMRTENFIRIIKSQQNRFICLMLSNLMFRLTWNVCFWKLETQFHRTLVCAPRSKFRRESIQLNSQT